MKLVILFFILITNVVTTSSAFAAEGLVTCTGADECNFCSFIEMVNGLVEWLIIIATTLVVLLLAFAGFRLITAAGDAAALENAKKLLVNSFIGILIMLAGWTIVDTFLKVFAGGDLGVWNTVQCGKIYESAPAADINVALEVHEFELGTMEPAVLHTGGHVGIDGESIPISRCDTSTMTTMNFLGHSVTIHSNLVASFGRIDAQWRSRGGNSFYRVYSASGYQCRNVAGTSRTSNHSYGIAIDINSATNPHNGVGGRPNVCQTDMPTDFRQLFLNEGWGWGCNWNSSKDAMHFSKASGEGGDMRF